MKLNWFGYKFIEVDGYGRFNLGEIRALLRRGVDVYPDTVDVLKEPRWLSRARGLDFGNLTISCVPLNRLYPVPGRQAVLSMWEAEKLPEEWANRANRFANWCMVPCEWLKGVFIENGVEIPVEVVRGGIEPDECPILSRDIKSRPFTFGCWGDRGSRKGFDLVWAAFYKAFGDNKDVRLLIKCRPGSLPFMDTTHSDPRLTIWREDVDRISDVFAHMDCFVFPTRGEGYGMPPREASACGIPTIVTAWSGTADFVDKWAFPLKTFTKSKSNLPAEGLWVNPDVDELVERMRWVYDNQEEARRIAFSHAMWLRQNETWDCSAARIVELTTQYL